ncbi:MAG: hypothetical protein U0838_02285 [Chloroflexota bacterium]
MRDDHREEAQAVDQERDRDAEEAHGESADGRAHDARAVEHRRVEGHRVLDVVAAHHLDAERLTGGHVDRVRHAQEQRKREDVPHLHDAGLRERKQDEREHHLGELRRDEGLPLGQRVGHDPAEQAEDHHRQELRGRQQPEHERVARELEHQPRLGDRLHPRAHERDALAAEEEPVVPMGEGARAVPEREARGHRPGSGAPPWGGWLGARPASMSARWRSL